MTTIGDSAGIDYIVEYKDDSVRTTEEIDDKYFVAKENLATLAEEDPDVVAVDQLIDGVSF